MQLYICIRVKVKSVRLCDSDFGITPVDYISMGINFAAFYFHIAHTSFASSWYLFCLSVIRLARLCEFGTATSKKKGVVCFLIHKNYVSPVKRHWFVLKYGAIPVPLEIFILQYIGWCVLVLWTFIFNQFSCFCQFLMDSFGQSIMSLYILGRCQLPHAAVMCWIVSDSFPHLLHRSSVSGCFKINFMLLLVSMTWSCIAVKKPSVLAKKSAFVSHLFNASMSTYCWLR